MQKKVVITLGKDGSVKAEAFGFKGSSCEAATEFLDNVFDGKNTTVVKDSYYEAEDKEGVLNVDGLPSGYCG